jgi:hypothetical protein
MKNLFETVRAMYAPKQIAEGNDGNLANNALPFNKVTKGDVIAGRLGKDAMGGKKKPAVKEEAETVEFSLTEEEWDQLDELSKSTLGSYVKKSSRDSRITRKIAADFENKADRARSPGMKDASNELSSRYKSKSFKRQAGLEKAVDRLTKEEVEQVDELSDKTLQSYTRKATTASNRASNRADKEEDKAMSTDGEKYPDKQARHNAAANQAITTMVKRDTGLKMAGKRLAKEDIELEQVDETVLHKDVEFKVNIAEKDYKAYFTSALKGKDLGSMSPEEKKKHFNKVDAGYKAKNEDVFLEAMFDSHINDIIAAHKKSGNRVSDEKSAMSDGKMKHSYVITTPEGKRTRHIHHGSTKKLETMSPAARSKQSQEQDLDDK